MVYFICKTTQLSYFKDFLFISYFFIFNFIIIYILFIVSYYLGTQLKIESLDSLSSYECGGFVVSGFF